MKQNIYPETYNIEIEKTHKILFIPYYFEKIQSHLDTKCTFSPISPQCLMIFGALSSAFILIKNINILNF